MKYNKDKINNFKLKLFINIEFAFKDLKTEFKETKEDIFINGLKSLMKKNDFDKKKFVEQFKDVGKLSLLIPLIALPGSPITIPLTYKIAKKFNIDLTPSSVKDSFNEKHDRIKEIDNLFNEFER